MKKIIYTFCLLIFVQCTTAPERAGHVTDVGIWQGKVLIQNKKTNNKKWANVTWASDSTQQKMRIDVYAALMDIPIATFIKAGDEAHLWLFTERKYYFSKDGEKLFKFLTKMTLNPNVFYSLLGSPQPPSDDWKCKDGEGVFQCLSQENKTKLLVEYKDNDRRVIKVVKALKALRLRLVRSKVEVSEKHFKLLSTSHYKTYKI